MQLYIESDAWHKIQYYVDTCKTEVSGLGKIERRDGDFYVTDVKIFAQDVSGAHSDIEAQALAEFQVELLKDGENPANWTLWWHSHANMNVFFSGRDIATIDESTDFRYMVSLVTNHAHDLLARVDVYDPARLHTELDVTLLLPEVPKKIADECQKEIDTKVRKKVSVSHKGKQTSFGFKSVSDVSRVAYPYSDFLYDDDDYGAYKYPSTYNGYNAYNEDDEDYEIDNKTTYNELKIEAECELDDARKSGDKASIQVAEIELAELVAEGKKQGYER